MKKSTRISIIDSKHKWGGVSTWNLNIARGLAAKDYYVAMLCRKKGFNYLRYRDTLKNIFPLNFGPDYNPIAIFGLYLFFKKNDISHIVVNVQKEIINAGIAARLAGCKTILRIGSVKDFIPKKKTRRLFSRYIDSIIVPCEGIKNEICSTFEWLNPNKIVVIYNGKEKIVASTSVERRQLRGQNGYSDKHLVIGFIGQLSNLKNIDLLVDAFKDIFSVNRDVRLLIGGDGSEMSFLKEKVLSLGLSEWVNFTGYVRDVKSLLDLMDIGVLTSMSEGFPNSVLEYMMAGLPVVASNVGCVSEAVFHKENGLLFESGDLQSLKSQLLLLINDKAMREQYGQSGKKMILEKFSENNMINSFIERIGLPLE